MMKHTSYEANGLISYPSCEVVCVGVCIYTHIYMYMYIPCAHDMAFWRSSPCFPLKPAFPRTLTSTCEVMPTPAECEPKAKAKAKAKAKNENVDSGEPGTLPPKAQQGTKRVLDEQLVAKKSLCTYFSYHLGKKSMDPAKRAEAESMKAEYMSLDKEMAGNFASKFMKTKDSKDFTWHKNFSETFQATKTEDTDILENYITRIAFF